MADLEDGETREVQGSGSARYLLKNLGGVYSCSCPAWRNQSAALDRRSCKHLRALRGDALETARVGAPSSSGVAKTKTKTDGTEASAPPLLLAHTWENDLDLSGWWMSEKLDGVRAYWDGKTFISRLGNPFHAPDWFVAKLPSHPLDGELWGGRKQFQRTVSVVRRQDRSDHWKNIAYLVFDAPHLTQPFEQRLQLIEQYLTREQPPYARAHTHQRCESLDHLRRELARVEALGGEGLMLRRPGSLYEVGRSSSLLKVKSFHDAEARVLEHLPGAGRHKGRLGALLVQMPDGTEFSVGTGFSDQERAHPPAVGALITYRYQELSEAGVPRFPSYVGLRIDAAWAADGKAQPAAKAQPVAKAQSVAKAQPVAKAQSVAKVQPVAQALPVAKADAAAKVDTAAQPRRFEMDEKFWEITLVGTGHTVRFGKLGTQGQTRDKVFVSAAAAARDAEDLIASKTAKGYRPS